MNHIDHDDPIDGPWGLMIISCKSTVEWEREQVLWARDRLDFGELSEFQREQYEWIAQDAARNLSQARDELEKWQCMHFNWLERREGA